LDYVFSAGRLRPLWMNFSGILSQLASRITTCEFRVQRTTPSNNTGPSPLFTKPEAHKA
jgi:hypothetical protein